VSSSFPIDLCQIKELLLDDLDLRVSHSRSGNPITKVNQRVNRFHAYGFGYAPQNARVFGRFEQSNSAAGRLIMPDDSLHPGRQFRFVIRRPFIEDGAHSFTVESQPESVLLRELGNLRFSILIV